MEEGSLEAEEWKEEEKCAARILPMRCGLWRGILWSPYCLHLQEKWERGLLKVTKRLWPGRIDTQMSACEPASELCSAEGYFVGGTDGKTVLADLL